LALMLSKIVALTGRSVKLASIINWVRRFMTLFILRDAAGNYLTKELIWVRDCTVAELYKTPHKDIALNQLIELNASDITLRAEVFLCKTDEKNNPVIPDSLSAA